MRGGVTSHSKKRKREENAEDRRTSRDAFAEQKLETKTIGK